MGAVAYRFVAALSGTPGATWIAATEDDEPGTGAYGIALLSRYPARTWQVLRLPRIPVRLPVRRRRPRQWVVVHEEPRAVVVGHLDTPAGPLVVANTHLDTPAGPLVVANTHLTFLPGWRRAQLSRIRRDLAGVAGPAVLMGDLNMPDPMPARITGYRSLARHPTFPSDRPDRQLDHILLRGRLGEVVATGVPELPLSDHRALVVDLAV